jgi:hypothetical protein
VAGWCSLFDMSSRPLPPAARGLAAAITGAVTAARAEDPDAFAAASEHLASLDPDRAGLLLGGMVRSVLEERHPDGLSAEDLQNAVEESVRSAARWFTELDPGVLVVLLTSAFGVHDTGEESARPTPLDVARHAPLLLAHLLDGAPRPFAGYLAGTLAEIERAETVELP